MAACKLLWLPVVFCLVLLSGHCEAQGLNHVVIFTFLGSDGGVCEFLLTTPSISATVRIRSDLGLDDELTVTRQDGQRFRVACENYRTRESGQIERKALLLTSDQIFVVQGINQVASSADGFLAVPPTGDATEFVLPSFTPHSTGGSQFYLAASANDTQVTIRYPDQSTEEVTLNLFETYGRRSNENDYTGTIVTSDKPIVVFSGHEYAQVPLGQDHPDHLVSSVPPVAQLGTQFIVPPIGDRFDSGYIVRVVAARDNTFVDAGSYGTQTVNAGQFVQMNVPDEEVPVRITCTYRCLVVQYNKGGTADDTDTDPFMLVVTPIQYYANRFTWLTPSMEDLREYDHYASIIVPSDQTDGVRLDGDTILTTWTVAEGTGYSGTAIAVDEGKHTLHHVDTSVQLAVSTHGHSRVTEEAYAFPAATDSPRSVFTTTTTTTTIVPDAEPFIIETKQSPVGETTQSPVQLISVVGYFSAASVISPDCRQRYQDAFLQRTSGVVEQINVLLGDGMCQFFPQGAVSVLKYTVDMLTNWPAENQGEVHFTVEVPAIPEHNYDDNHRCGVEIQMFMQEHSNYEQPVFPPVEGCPDLTPTVPGSFEENFRRW